MEIKLTRKNKLGEIEKITYQDIESEIDFQDYKSYADPLLPTIVDRLIERALETKSAMESELHFIS